MNDSRTASMQQRVPVILAVTAHAYGLVRSERSERREPAEATRDARAGTQGQAAPRR